MIEAMLYSILDSQSIKITLKIKQKTIMKKISRIICITSSLLLLASIQACSQQQVVSSAVSVAKLPVRAAGAVAGAAGGVVGGTVGGVVGGNIGKRIGHAVGSKAARAAVPKL